MCSLLACVLMGFIPAQKAFEGFGHPAVITVACILIISYGLQSSGAVTLLAKKLLPESQKVHTSILMVTLLGTLLSGFMNNVGALALLMPIALQMARKLEISPGKVLMPLSFGTILGGMTTLIGTPPNLIVSGFRLTTTGTPFSLFDFTLIGSVVALAGTLFITLLGWRLIPERNQGDSAGFSSGNYLSEIKITAKSKVIGKRLREVEQHFDEIDGQITAMVRNDVRISAPHASRMLKENDILIIEIDPESLAPLMSKLGAELEGEKFPTSVLKPPPASSPSTDTNNTDSKPLPNDDIELQEFVVSPRSSLVDRSAAQLQIRSRYGINLLALSRQGKRTIRRLRSTRLQPGDLLLLQGTHEALYGFASEFDCLPLAARDIRVPKREHALMATVIFLAAIILTTFSILPSVIAFTLAAVSMTVVRIVPVRSLYHAIDWPIIILLAGMLPLATAMESTGTAEWMASFLLDYLAHDSAVLALTLVMTVTMLLSNVMNNAATAALMCPIAISIATQLSARHDSFLMAVAIGASSAFLTPIGHQNNTLILGPGGFRFGDYWRLGIWVQLIVLVVAIPGILIYWSL
jgi:di/tricarboxylate transporter